MRCLGVKLNTGLNYLGIIKYGEKYIQIEKKKKKEATIKSKQANLYCPGVKIGLGTEQEGITGKMQQQKEK